MRAFGSWIIRSFVTVVVLMLSTSCGQKNQEDSRVRMAYLPHVASLPIFVAETDGYFSQRDVVPEKILFESSNDMVNSLLAGQTDVLPAVALIPILHLELQSPGRVRIFSHSRMTPEVAFDSIVVRADSPIQALADLSGKRIGTFPGTSSTHLLQAFLAKHGVSSETVTVIPLAPPAQLQALSSGAIDALFSYEPTTTIALKDASFRKLFGSVYADLLNPSPFGCSVVLRSFERSNPKSAEKTIAAIDEAVKTIRKDPVRAKSLLSTFTKIDHDIAQKVNLVDVTTSDEVNVASVQAFIDLLVTVGELPERLDAHRLVDP